MNKSDEQLAHELDLFLTARLNGRPLPPVSDELLKDIAFVDDLLEATAQVESEQAFLAGLQTQLAAEAGAQQQKARKTVSRPEQAANKRPFWEAFTEMLKDQLTMKRAVFTLGAAMALFLFAFMAWTAFQGIGPDEPGVIVETGTETAPVETAEPVEVAELPTLPSLSNAPGLGGGFGGGGGDGEVTESAGTEPGLDMTIFNPLSGTQFILNATLPLEPVSAVVYQQPEGAVFTVEDVPGLAALFGLNGPVYLENYYIEEGSDWTPIPVYQVFDGAKNLAVGSNYLYYYDDAATVYTGSGAQPMPFEQARPIAEAFLAQTGLVDFEYLLVSQNGYDVEVRRLIDGREAIFPIMSMAINDRGEIWSFSYNPLNQLSALGEYPLRSAEAAWQHMLDNGVDFQSVFFHTHPAEFLPQEPPVTVEDEYRYWQRFFEPGAEVTLYSYPSVFEAVNGDAAPRILADFFLLTGPTDQLEAITDYVGRQILIQGIAGEMVGNRQTLELVSWEPVEKEYFFAEGNIQIGEGPATLTTDDGVTYIIPDVPADLNNGERIYVSGWVEEGGRGEDATFNWQSMGVVVPPTDVIEGEPEPMPIDGPMNPFNISEVTIDQVNLLYAILSVWNEESQSATYFAQPVWQFKGLTNTGDIIEIYVQAVDNQFVEQPVQ